VHLKAGFATAAVVLACFQLFSAAWIFRKLPWRKPAWVNLAHRWSGRLAFAFTLPVAYHCIFKLGFQHPDGRVLAHSLLGCAVYGGYAAKVMIVRLHGFPRFVLPLAGATLFTILIGVWYTSALWLYQHTTSAAPAYATPAPIPANAHAAAGAAVFVTLQPTYLQVQQQVQNGSGVVPSFKNSLSAQQIRDVAAFVALRATG
jgi:hypothetical protein